MYRCPYAGCSFQSSDRDDIDDHCFISHEDD